MNYIKKATLLIMFISCLLSISSISYAAKTENYSFETAQQIITRNRLPFYFEEDNQTKYYHTDIICDGSIELEVEFPKKCDFNVSLYDGKKNLLFEYTGNQTDSAHSKRMGTQKGDDFYVVVHGKKAGRFYINYNFKEYSWAKGNNSFEKAFPINVDGNKQGYSRSSKKVDYYKVIIPEPGYLYINYYRESDYKHYHHIAVYDEKHSQLWKKDILYKDRTDSPYFKVPKGCIYIKVNGANSSIYTITTYFTKASKKTPRTPENFRLYEMKKSMKVAWKAPFSNVSGYQIQYALNYKFTDKLKSVRVNDPKATSTKITGLSDGTTYFVRIRAFYTVNNKTYYSSWSDSYTASIQ